MVRRSLAAAIVLVAAACGGGGDDSGGSFQPTTLPAVLTGGSYMLSLTRSRTGQPVCNGQFCTDSSICTGDAGAYVTSLQVAVERNGARTDVIPSDRTATFRMRFDVTGTSVAGEAWGSFRDANGAVVTLAGPSPASLAAVSGVLTGWGAGGALDGAFNVGAAGCSNNGHTWLLRPR